ncbi:MAG TPA: hypothetical protein VMW19_17195 [Myxococcota bacterium]|nr:hypothetical protein [Myxococcota bacterium]
MLRMHVVRAALCAASIVIVNVPSAVRACSVCQAGDPLFSATGSTGLESGRWSAYLEFQAWEKQSGLLQAEPDEEPPPGREVNDGRQLSLHLAVSPIDRVTLSLMLPWRWNKISEQPAGEPHDTVRNDGFGDATLNLGVVLWRDRDVLPATWLEARGFVKAPTGASKQRVDGEVDPHLQVGTGSWDFGAGLAGAHRMEWDSLYASALFRENLEGSLHYRYGDVVLANLALDAPLSHFLDAPLFGLLTPGVELNFRYAAKDQFHGSSYDSSGGSLLYATPSIRVWLPFASQLSPSLRLAVQIPLTDQWLYGQQDEKVVWSAGLAVGF